MQEQHMRVMVLAKSTPDTENAEHSDQRLSTPRRVRRRVARFPDRQPRQGATTGSRSSASASSGAALASRSSRRCRGHVGARPDRPRRRPGRRRPRSSRLPLVTEWSRTPDDDEVPAGLAGMAGGPREINEGQEEPIGDQRGRWVPGCGPEGRGFESRRARHAPPSPPWRCRAGSMPPASRTGRCAG